MRGRYRVLLGALASWLASIGCRDLERFDTTGDDAAYCGQIVQAPFQTGFLPDSAEPPVIGMRLEFDIHSLGSYPGRIATDDGAQGLCAPQPLFDEQRLRAVTEAFHDPISMLEFGDGRERNILAWVDSSCRGTFLGVVSLMRDDSIELRLFKPAPEPDPNTQREDLPGFAEFRLQRNDEGCSF
ncbi:MAG: hypothetical protein JW751_26665 [Polyangiaceae bacterium]|nr:hypothetical protein [Polyangiaceae bacterium]